MEVLFEVYEIINKTILTVDRNGEQYDEEVEVMDLFGWFETEEEAISHVKDLTDNGRYLDSKNKSKFTILKVYK